MKTTSKTTILISGASVAGPTLAYWLHRHGFDVTIVERATATRGGGYPIDIRGTAVDVVERMGLLPVLQSAHVDTRLITFVNAKGRTVGKVRPESLTGGTEGRDLELARGDLSAALFAATRQDAEYIFGDSIATMRDDGSHVDVTFDSGVQRTFDMVVGADGLHSNVRRLTSGPEEQFLRYLGRCFVGFTLPNSLGLAHEGILYNTPGKMAALYAAGDTDTLHGLLVVASPQPRPEQVVDVASQRNLMAEAFAGEGWETPRMVAAMRDADDLYFDTVSQVRMTGWSKGRIGLVGDAAYAPSFLSGQGTSLALVGAYVLAGELSGAAGDPSKAFAAYETLCRPFVTANQALAKDGKSSLLPMSAADLWMRNQALKLLPLIARTGLAGREERRAASALKIADYAV